MYENDVILTGLPRSGTTLTCHLLNKLPDTVALHEPMQGVDYGDTVDAREMSRGVKRFFDEQRQSILQRGRALSRNIGGVVPDNPFGDEPSETGARRQIDQKGEIVIDKELSNQFMLIMKHTHRFAPLLGHLVELMPVFAIVRNPLSTLASWRTIDAGIASGRPGPAGRVVPELGEAMARYDDVLDRQIYLLGWFWQQFHRHLPKHAIIEYETLVASGGRALSVINPGAIQLDEPLQSRNSNPLYDREDMLRIGERLLESEGAYWENYPRESVTLLLAEIAASSGSR
jgi:hypothetical protein